ncbi:hypothetical protein AHF37_12415 [Paragonimus kellicotti]|nr:hypothetical protein AHF37_12415 [Paragonimus kellicotti]
MEASNFKALLKRDTLNCKEAEVFAAVRRWTGAECVRLGLRDVLQNRAQVAAEFLHLVRFPTMTLSEFAENVAYSGFLTLETVSLVRSEVALTFLGYGCHVYHDRNCQT